MKEGENSGPQKNPQIVHVRDGNPDHLCHFGRREPATCSSSLSAWGRSAARRRLSAWRSAARWNLSTRRGTTTGRRLSARRRLSAWRRLSARHRRVVSPWGRTPARSNLSTRRDTTARRGLPAWHRRGLSAWSGDSAGWSLSAWHRRDKSTRRSLVRVPGRFAVSGRPEPSPAAEVWLVSGEDLRRSLRSFDRLCRFSAVPRTDRCSQVASRPPSETSIENALGLCVARCGSLANSK
jgi:hypothetical protein